MHRQTCLGGLNLPNLTFYYKTARIVQILSWQVKHNRIPSVQLEANSIYLIALTYLLWADNPKEHCTPQLNRIVHLSLTQCLTYRTIYKLKSKDPPLLPLFGNPEIQPGIARPAFKWWIDQGLQSISGFWTGHMFTPFSLLGKHPLRNNTDTPKSDTFQLQAITCRQTNILGFQKTHAMQNLEAKHYCPEYTLTYRA